jgi:D-arabinose 1-dehydrogenase-like Zn-dependent alcohol dehydrogenase
LNGAEGWTPGERVAVGWFGGNCGTCLACREGDFIHCERLKIPGYSYPGGYSEAVVVPATALARIPDTISAVEAAPMGCAGVTTFNALRRGPARRTRRGARPGRSRAPGRAVRQQARIRDRRHRPRRYPGRPGHRRQHLLDTVQAILDERLPLTED